MLLVFTGLWRGLEGGGGAVQKVSVGHAWRESGRSLSRCGRSFCSSAAPRPLSAAGAPPSVARKPWRSPKAVCTWGCAWLQRWRLSWQDLRWVSVQAASPEPGERPRSTPGPAVLGSCARPGGDVELSEFHPDRKPNGIPLGLPNKVCTKSRSIKCSLSSLDCCKGN